MCLVSIKIYQLYNCDLKYLYLKLWTHVTFLCQSYRYNWRAAFWYFNPISSAFPECLFFCLSTMEGFCQSRVSSSELQGKWRQNSCESISSSCSVTVTGWALSGCAVSWHSWWWGCRAGCWSPQKLNSVAGWWPSGVWWEGLPPLLVACVGRQRSVGWQGGVQVPRLWWRLELQEEGQRVEAR